MSRCPPEAPGTIPGPTPQVWGWVAAAGILVVGMVSAVEPAIAWLAASTILVCVVALARPASSLWIACLTLVVSAQYLAPHGFRLGGFEMSTWQAGLVLAMAIPPMVTLGLRKPLNTVIVAYAAVLATTFTVATRFPGLGLLQPFKSFTALALAPLLFQIRLGPSRSLTLLRLATWLAPISVAIGGVLQITGIRGIIRVDSGVPRLQGASIPPHLAMLATVGLLAGLVLARYLGRKSLVLASVNLCVVVFSGSRGAVAVSLLLISAYIALEFMPALKAGRFRPGRVLAIIGVVSLSLGIYAPLLIERFNSPSSASGAINTSGRISAWSYFWSVAEENLTFGRGLGASTIANQGDLPIAFRVPHNEYLRLLVDGGVFGLVVVLIGHWWLFSRILRRTSRQIKLLISSAILGFALLALVDNILSTLQWAIPFWLVLSAVGWSSEMTGTGHLGQPVEEDLSTSVGST